ncbi:hypothetical protein GCM10011332_24330 [Terasakiella brassicae]|uniref:Uncharacterized protein n=1 Tax=Terasakiella brassicae TaxID=1634917 RepID=A0A917C2N3_9PROT|nr:hypothetical protein [Terasakiella brassicae]GGF69277.1 hypothetical protein GCM10011332_24330 [Terasakiella brassicae]
MVGLFQTIMDQIFGSASPPPDMLADDGGLAEFAKQYAAQMEEEKKFGKKPSVSGDDVIHIQHGRHGARAYLLDTSAFRKALVKELRPSIPPVTEGILKTRCGEKGVGYMHVDAFYAFHIHKNDAVEEYNAALGIIDEIGARLLGDRYTSGERKPDIPMTRVLPQDIVNPDGTFNIQRAKKAIKLVVEKNISGPTDTNWQDGKISIEATDPTQYVPLPPRPAKKDYGDWTTQPTRARPTETNLTPSTPTKNNPPPAQQWQSTIGQKAQHSHEAKTARSWLDTPQPSPANTAAERQAQTLPPKSLGVQPTRLRQLGDVVLAFHPTWQRHTERIDCYVGFAFRHQDNTLFKGDQFYPASAPAKTIHRIDKAIAKQGVQHLEHTSQLDQKTIFLPFHLESILAEKKASPLNPLHNLPEQMRHRLRIEIIGLGQLKSTEALFKALQLHQNDLPHIGIQIENQDIPRDILENEAISFVSYDMSLSSPNTHHTSHLSAIAKMAHKYKKHLCTWGVKNKQDIERALQEQSAYLNGRGLARDMRKPGKIIPLPASRMLLD